jgi:hypothetical protein
MSIDPHALPDFFHPSPPHPLQWEVVYPPVFVNDVNLVINRISMRTRAPHTNLIKALYLPSILLANGNIRPPGLPGLPSLSTGKYVPRGNLLLHLPPPRL